MDPGVSLLTRDPSSAAPGGPLLGRPQVLPEVSSSVLAISYPKSGKGMQRWPTIPALCPGVTCVMVAFLFGSGGCVTLGGRSRSLQH